MTLGKGTRKELKFAVRAIRAARTHLKNARCGTKGGDDEVTLSTLVVLGSHADDLLKLLGMPSALSAALRKFEKSQQAFES